MRCYCVFKEYDFQSTLRLTWHVRLLPRVDGLLVHHVPPREALAGSRLKGSAIPVEGELLVRIVVVVTNLWTPGIVSASSKLRSPSLNRNSIVRRPVTWMRKTFKMAKYFVAIHFQTSALAGEPRKYLLPKYFFLDWIKIQNPKYETLWRTPMSV